MRTWADNAEEFAALSRQGKDLRLAILVACSVEDRPVGRPSKSEIRLKVSAREFALKANTGHHRVIRHLDAWERLAEDGYVNHARFLKPEHVNETYLSDEAQHAFNAMVIGVERNALREAATPTTKPVARLAYSADNAVELARMTLAPIIRQASFAVEAISNLQPHERHAVAEELQLLKVIFSRLADGLPVERTQLLEANG